MNAETFAHSPDFAAIVLSLKVGATATLLSLPFGFAAAYIGTRLRPRAKAAFDTFVNLPLTLPPVVIGYLLLLLLGRGGWPGAFLRRHGVQILFTWKAAVIASAVVGFPLLVRSIRISIEAIDGGLVQAARTLGAGRLDTMATIIAPLSLPGSGKSTLIGILSGLIAPDTGSVSVDGDPLFSSSPPRSVPPERRRIAVVFQRSLLFPHLDVRRNLLYGQARRPGGHRGISMETVANILRIEPLLDRGVRDLSGGEQRRVSLARALLAYPRLLLLDEPLSGLDDPLKFEIIRYLNRVHEEFGIPFLFISHDLLEMRLLTDWTIVLADGRITESAATEVVALQWSGRGVGAYTNLLRISGGRELSDLYAYRWGAGELLLAAKAEGDDLFELSSRDIVLFRRNPKAISARNLLECRVTRLLDWGKRTGVELAYGGETLVAEVMRESVAELSIAPGVTVYAAVKASAFRPLR